MKPNLDYINKDYIFAALKLIEQLYIDGEIPKFMFRNILKEYSDIINTADFTTHFTETTEVTNEK